MRVGHLVGGLDVRVVPTLLALEGPLQQRVAHDAEQQQADDRGHRRAGSLSRSCVGADAGPG